MSRKEIAPLVLYHVVYLALVLVPPLIRYENCKTSPHFFSHILFGIVQIILILASICYHRRKQRAMQQ